MPDVHLPLNLTVEEFSGEQLRLTGDTDVLITSLLLQASTQDQHIQLDNFDVKSPQGTLSVQGQATLTGDWPVALTANSALNIEPLKGEKVKLNIGGGLRDELKVALNLSGPVGAQLDAQTQLAEAGLPLTLEVVRASSFTGRSPARRSIRSMTSACALTARRPTTRCRRAPI